MPRANLGAEAAEAEAEANCPPLGIARPFPPAVVLCAGLKGARLSPGRKEGMLLPGYPGTRLSNGYRERQGCPLPASTARTPAVRPGLCRVPTSPAGDACARRRRAPGWLRWLRDRTAGLKAAARFGSAASAEARVSAGDASARWAWFRARGREWAGRGTVGRGLARARGVQNGGAWICHFGRPRPALSVLP